MTYQAWIAAVLAIARGKRIDIQYYEGPGISGERSGHFEGYCSGRLTVWAGAGAELPQYGTTPAHFAGWWPVCETQPAPGIPIPRAEPVIVAPPGARQPSGAGYIPYRVRRAVVGGIGALMGGRM